MFLTVGKFNSTKSLPSLLLPPGQKYFNPEEGEKVSQARSPLLFMSISWNVFTADFLEVCWLISGRPEAAYVICIRSEDRDDAGRLRG